MPTNGAHDTHLICIRVCVCVTQTRARAYTHSQVAGMTPEAAIIFRYRMRTTP
jgi:hypothetical protein